MCATISDGCMVMEDYDQYAHSEVAVIYRSNTAVAAWDHE